VAYLEPWYDEGQLPVCVEIRMTVQDAINYTRNKVKYENIKNELSDQELLDEFMVVHWAYYVE